MGHASRHSSDSCSRTAVSLSFWHIPSIPLSRLFSRVRNLRLCAKRLETNAKPIIWRANLAHARSNMSSLFIESLDLAISPDNRHLQTARAAISTEAGRTSGTGSHGDTLHKYASSSGQRGQEPPTKSSHSLPNEHELQHGSNGDLPHRSVDHDVADERAQGQDACEATTEHMRRCPTSAAASSGRLENNQHGDAGETSPQLSRDNSGAPKSAGNATADDPDVQCRESVTEILSRLVPKDSALQSSLDWRRSKMWLVDDDEVLSVKPFGFKLHEPPSVLRDVSQRIAAGCLVIIEDLNTKACKAMESEYPLLDRQFLAEPNLISSPSLTTRCPSSHLHRLVRLRSSLASWLA